MQPGHLLNSYWLRFPTKSESEPKEKNIFEREKNQPRIVQFDFYFIFHLY